MARRRTDTGKNLKRKWKIPADQVLYRENGAWFMPLTKFPAALCDKNGYVLFSTREEYESSRHIKIGKRINVRGGISKIPGYILFRQPDSVRELPSPRYTRTVPAVQSQNAVELERIRTEKEREGAFNPADLPDARTRILTAIVLRQGRRDFRERCLAAYRNSCAITGCNVVEVLEAAHIVAYRGPETNHVTNGLLLRADIHTLFDLGLLAVNPQDYQLMVSRRLRGTAYESLDGQKMRLPISRAEYPSRVALEVHMAAFQSKESVNGHAE